MDNQNEKNAYITKLQSLKDGIVKILDLPSNRIVTAEISDELSNLKKKADLMQEKLISGEFEIAVVGLEKAGKSSFSNALANLQILPTADARCTYTSTCIKPGSSNSATITFLTSEELNKDLKEKLAFLQIANASNWNLDNLSQEKYAQLFGEIPADLQERYGDSINEDISEMLANKTSLRQYLNKPPRNYSGDEIQDADFKKFITDPARAMAVKEIVIYSTELKEMPNAVLYDVPGFDSPTAMHKQQTLEKMNSADAIIAVADAKAPSLTGPALDVFKQTDMDGNALSDKLFVFANKADLIKDTAALAENKETTRREWMDKRKILSQQSSNRIYFGSAYAAEGDAGARAKLKELGIDDGIRTMREKLELYNRNERFEVLKRRIGKLMFDVKKLFEAVDLPQQMGNRGQYENSYGKILLDLVDKLRPALRERLNTLRHDMNKSLEADKPLSHDIESRISNIITKENFGLRQDETEKLHQELHGVNTGAEMPPSLDTALRRNRFRAMYGAFCDEVQGSAVSRHREISDNIRKLFMDSFGIAPNQEGYDELAIEVDRFCGFEDQNDVSYYDSLLERFARDLFEALILSSQGQERLNKFRAEMANYFSMGVYYDSGDGQIANSSPLDSNFWRLLLYPEMATAPQFSEVLEITMKGSGLPQIGKPMQQMLMNLLVQKGKAVLDVLGDILRTLPMGANEAVVAAALKKGLEIAVSETTDDVASILDDGYLRDVQQRRGNYTYKAVQEELDNDIDALRLTLSRAFIPAVNMEKAFGARETRRIENIRDSLLGDEFRNFISRNVAIIEAAALGQLCMAESQRLADEAVLNEINSILAAIDNAS